MKTQRRKFAFEITPEEAAHAEMAEQGRIAARRIKIVAAMARDTEAIKRWTRKARLAATKLRKLRASQRHWAKAYATSTKPMQ